MRVKKKKGEEMEFLVDAHTVTQKSTPPTRRDVSKRQVIREGDPHFQKVMEWKISRCPSCGTVGGWRIGSRFCLACVEWRSLKPLKKKSSTLR